MHFLLPLPDLIIEGIGIMQGGVSYIAQVLKRNRTLKTLNLSDNKIEVQGLVLLAEALVSPLLVLRVSGSITNFSKYP